MKDGWQITDDPYVISYGERFLFIDLAARELDGFDGEQSYFLGAERAGNQIAIEIKEFRGNSAIAALEQAIGQYVLYQLLFKQVDPGRDLYLAVGSTAYNEAFREPIGEIVIQELPLDVLIVRC